MVWPLKEILYVISGFVSLVVALNHLYWWQTKEYRLDRMLTWAIYDRGFKELLSLKSRRPKLTLRILMIIFVALVFLAAFVPALYSSPYWILGVLLLPGIAALTTATGTAVSAPFTNLLARQEVSQAKKLVEKLHPKIIAITGSYGKSSSKEFLAALLSGSFQDSGNHGRKTVDEAISRTRFSALPSGTKPWASAHGSLYKVVKTQASENTPLGIARRINSSLKPDTNILILEMGAYKRGEIRYLAALFPPHISWITAIGPQHIGLFGSLENIKLAKYEAVRALKENGFAVLPADSSDEKDLVNLAKKENRKVLTYSLKNNPATIHGTITEKTDRGFKLSITEEEKEWSVTVPLRGLHYGANVLGAVAIARLLKIDKSKIMTTIAKLKQPPHQLELKKLKNGVTLIDNSYNTNLDGFLASIEYLKTFPGRTFVVTPGIIELGRFSQKIHSELGQKLKGIDHVWVTNLKHADDLSSPENHVTGEENMNKIFSDMRDTLRKGDTLLIEGRIPESLKSDILKL